MPEAFFWNSPGLFLLSIFIILSYPCLKLGHAVFVLLKTGLSFSSMSTHRAHGFGFCMGHSLILVQKWHQQLLHFSFIVFVLLTIRQCMHHIELTSVEWYLHSLQWLMQIYVPYFLHNTRADERLSAPHTAHLFGVSSTFAVFSSLSLIS
mgnify:FL=1